MTERLTQLLTDEAAGLDAPAPPAAAVLARGRKERSRRRAGLAATGIGAVAAVTAGVVALNGLGTEQRTAPDLAGSTDGSTPIYAVGNTVYYPGAIDPVRVDDKAIKSLFYTAAGIVVRHGDNANSDGGGPQRFSLIGSDGTVHRLGLETEETVHASDPTQPYIVYAENAGGALDIVVYDVVADTEKARIKVAQSDQDWFPVSLTGDHVVVQDGYNGVVYVVDWKHGGTTAYDSDEMSAWDAHGGYSAVSTRQGSSVIEVATGKTVFTAPKGPGYGELSADGRSLLMIDEDAGMRGDGAAVSTTVYDVATGEPTTLDSEATWWSWTADGDLFTVDEDGTMTTCDAGTGDCSQQQVDLPAAPPEECYTVTTGTKKNRVIESGCAGGTLDIILGGQTRES